MNRDEFFIYFSKWRKYSNIFKTHRKLKKILFREEFKMKIKKTEREEEGRGEG